MTHRRSLASSLAVVWTATIAGAALAAAGIRLVDGQPPYDALGAAPSTALALLAHNVPVAVWPFALIALGWTAMPGARVAGDVLVAGQLVSHGLIAGSLIAQHTTTWRFVPHLPVEWLALALPAAAWLHARTSRNVPAIDPRDLGVIAAGCLGALAAAALIETYLTPVV